MTMNATNEVRRVKITLPLFPTDYLELINELTCMDCNMTIQTHPQVIIETEVTDEQRAIFENFHCSVEAFPTLTELRTRVFELLKEGEELELDYPVYVLREGCWEEYYEKVVSVELIDEGSLQCNCECCDILVNELTEEEQEEVFQNIIDKLEQDDE